MHIDLLLLLGVILLGMALGALLTTIRWRSAIVKAVRQQLHQETEGSWSADEENIPVQSNPAA